MGTTALIPYQSDNALTPHLTFRCHRHRQPPPVGGIGCRDDGAEGGVEPLHLLQRPRVLFAPPSLIGGVGGILGEVVLAFRSCLGGPATPTPRRCPCRSRPGAPKRPEG